MQEKPTSYVARAVNDNGFVQYSDAENRTWETLFKRQMPLLERHACTEYLEGLTKLQLSPTSIPQIPELNRKLKRATGWQVVNVPALIDDRDFFGLLADRKFPIATFIRRPEHLDYIEEPDIFHEVIGHLPLLMNPWLADFTQRIGALARYCTDEELEKLGRLYWFTLEFGLLVEKGHIKALGAGIMSSSCELVRACTDDPDMEIRPFSLMEVVQREFIISEPQPVYFLLESIKALDTLDSGRISTALKTAPQASTSKLHRLEIPVGLLIPAQVSA